MGFAPEPENVYSLLTSNLSFARVCGLVPIGADTNYWYKYVPSLRKLEQFDQIMTEYGLWSKAKWDHVRENIDNKIIHKENELVGDTTHYHAHSVFKTVEYTDSKGNEKKKSQSKTTKKCRCEDVNIRLRASLNPRRKKIVTINLPRGMEKITPYDKSFSFKPLGGTIL